jgi:hypothetical protein
MHNRSNRGSGEPVCPQVLRARASDLGPGPRIALGPAVIVPRKQAGHMTALDQCASMFQKTLAKWEPSTHGGKAVIKIHQRKVEKFYSRNLDQKLVLRG